MIRMMPKNICPSSWEDGQEANKDRGQQMLIWTSLEGAPDAIQVPNTAPLRPAISTIFDLSTGMSKVDRFHSVKYCVQQVPTQLQVLTDRSSDSEQKNCVCDQQIDDGERDRSLCEPSKAQPLLFLVENVECDHVGGCSYRRGHSADAGADCQRPS